MKTWALVVIVVLLHGAAISALFVLQGCRTPVVREPVPPEVVMPPARPPDAPPPPAEPDTKTYTIRAGDSISVIAQRFNTSQAEIMALNNLDDPNRIRIGQELRLPGYVDLGRPAPKPRTPVAAVDSGEVYVVQPMDSISTIARRLKVCEDELVKLNELPDRNRIRVGQKLLIPESAERRPEPRDRETIPVSDDRPDVRSPISIYEDEVETPVRTEVFHIVEPGQDLASVARLYAVSVEELADINGMSPGDRVPVGRRLIIP